MTNTDELSNTAPSMFSRLASGIAGGFLALLSVGVVVGYSKAAMLNGALDWKAAVVFFVAALILAGGLWLLWRSLRGQQLATTPRMREYQLVMVGTILLGVLLGFVVQMGSADSGKLGLGALTDNAPLSPGIAAVMLAALPLLAWLTYRWHKTADEHEQAAYNFGALLSLYAYFFVSTGWWIGWRGGIVGEPSGVAIFWMVLAVWTLGWVVRRSR